MSSRTGDHAAEDHALVDDDDCDDISGLGPVEPLDERIAALTLALLSQIDGWGRANCSTSSASRCMTTQRR